MKPRKQPVAPGQGLEVLLNSIQLSRASSAIKVKGVDSDFLAKVARHGIKQPLIVRKVAKGQLHGPGVIYELVRGRMRFEAAVRCKLKTVPVEVTSIVSSEAVTEQVREAILEADTKVTLRSELPDRLIRSVLLLLKNELQKDEPLGPEAQVDRIAVKLRIPPAKIKHLLVQEPESPDRIHATSESTDETGFQRPPSVRRLNLKAAPEVLKLQLREAAHSLEAVIDYALKGHDDCGVFLAEAISILEKREPALRAANISFENRKLIVGTAQCGREKNDALRLWIYRAWRDLGRKIAGRRRLMALPPSQLGIEAGYLSPSTELGWPPRSEKDLKAFWNDLILPYLRENQDAVFEDPRLRKVALQNGRPQVTKLERDAIRVLRSIRRHPSTDYFLLW